MAIPDYKSFSIDEYPIQDIDNISIGIVKTEWNSEIIDKLVESCIDTLRSCNITADNIHTFKVPGSFELPLGAKYLLSSNVKPDAVICLGCVIKGATKHDDYINHSIAKSISQLGLVSNTPVIFGVLTTNTLEQAIERAGGAHGNKGEESALSALKMISLKQELSGKASKISF